MHRNEHDQPIGAPVPGWEPPPRPTVDRLAGQWCSIDPLTPEHADELFPEVAGPGNEALWTYLADGPHLTITAMHDHVARRLAGPDVQLVIRDDNGVACGLASLMRIEPAHGVVEVGSIVLGPRLQRTRAATEAMSLLARHVFDLGYRRYEWKCDDLNAPSRRAAERLGFTYEGTFRRHVVTKGRSRDTAWFAMTLENWSRIRAAHDAWLAPENFDDGAQRSRLGDLVAGPREPGAQSIPCCCC